MAIDPKSWFEALFGRFMSRGVDLDALGAVNFESPLLAVANEAEGRIDVGIDLSDVDAAAVAPVFLVVSSGSHTVTAADWGTKDPAVSPLYIIYTGTSGGFALTLRGSDRVQGETVYVVRTSSANAQSITITPVSASVQTSSDGTLSDSVQNWQSSSTGVGMIVGLRCLGSDRRWLPIAGQRPNYYAAAHLRSTAANVLYGATASGGGEQLSVAADSVLAREGTGNLASVQQGRWSRLPATTVTASESANLTHVGTVRRFNLAAPGTYTVPPQSDITWIGQSAIHIEVISGSAPLTITPGSGVTISSIDASGLVLRQGQSAVLRQRGTNQWDLITARRIRGLISDDSALSFTPPGMSGIEVWLSPRSATGNAALADAATFTRAIEIQSTNNSVRRVSWFWYVGVAGSPAYAAGHYEVIYFRGSSSSDLHILSEGMTGGSVLPLGWSIAASVDSGAGELRLNLTNNTGAARKAYARPQFIQETLN